MIVPCEAPLRPMVLMSHLATSVSSVTGDFECTTPNDGDLWLDCNFSFR